MENIIAIGNNHYDHCREFWKEFLLNAFSEKKYYTIPPAYFRSKNREFLLYLR
jgi:hypothetical protein